MPGLRQPKGVTPPAEGLGYSARMTVLAMKLLLAPLLVVASSLAGRRWGPQVAGILVVLPVVAGPILLILYLEHGSRFAAHAARAATLGIVPLALFAFVFGYLSRRHGWLATLAFGWIAVLVADLVLAQVDVPAVVALALAVTINDIGGAAAFGLATAAAVIFAIFLVAKAPARSEERLP